LSVLLDPVPRSEPSIWHAPLVPVALAATGGIILDRYAQLPLPVYVLTSAAALVAWAAARRGRSRGLPLVYLALAVGALGAGYYHWRRDVYSADDIRRFATPDPRPVQLRGVLVEEPVIFAERQSALRSVTRMNPTVAVLRVSQIKQDTDWVAASGRAQLRVSGSLSPLHVGDEIEIVGRLQLPHGPANPGEADQATKVRDRGIRAVVTVAKMSDAVTLRTRGWFVRPSGWLAQLGGWAQRTLQRSLPPELSGVASALLLGHSDTMTEEDWDKYKRTGVIHALAISGQHLIILAAFLWRVLWFCGVQRRHGALFVALFILGYALLTGGRPPAMRAAVMVCAGCGSLMLHRPPMLANLFALALLIVAMVNPADLFDPGCQLSFLAVAVLHWGITWRPGRPVDLLDRLVEKTRPGGQKALRWLGRQALSEYVVMLAVWSALLPLVAARSHTVPLVAFFIGPPLLYLTATALIAGFLLLLVAPLGLPLTFMFAWIAQRSLAGCEFLVNTADRLPGGHWYISDVPEWWLWGFYLTLLAVLTTPALRQRWRWMALAGLTWLCVGLLSGAARMPTDELRCTFLAVGHGGCTVLETADGRTLLYDAGSLSGPEVTQRQIAPYLWSRRIRRIDEVILYQG
jgi:competence protein ComEC